MYHGIIAGSFPVTRLEKKDRLHQATIELSYELAAGLVRGASVSVDGVCLTVANLEIGNSPNTNISFDMMGETLDRTTLQFLKVGDYVNIERSARLGDEIGGHPISGHIDGLAQITNIEAPINNYIVNCSLPEGLMPYIFTKGYIAINGASLTIVDVDRKHNSFSIHLIPETLRLTTFRAKKVGDFLNIEIERSTQVLVDTVRNFLDQQNLAINTRPTA